MIVELVSDVNIQAQLNEFDDFLPLLYGTIMKLIFAPMATLSHAGMRGLISGFGGCDEYYTEMIHASAFIHGGKFEPFYSLSNPEPEKIVWQLTDSLAEPLAQTAAILMEQEKPRWHIPDGFRSGDKRAIGIDINMGCSAPEIFKQGAGVAWMCKPLSETADMLKGVRQAFSGRLSCKIRLGDELKLSKGDSHSNSDFFSESHFYEFLDMLIESGVTQIVLHPRTRKEKMSRLPRYKYIQDAAVYVHKKAVEKNTNISFIGNGNISCVADYNHFCKICPDADGVMIARAAIQKPWLFSQLANSQIANASSKTNADIQNNIVDLYLLAESFIGNLQKYQPQEFYKTRSQRFFTYYCDNFSFAQHLRTKILNVDTIDEILPILLDYFNKMPNEQFVTLDKENKTKG